MSLRYFLPGIIWIIVMLLLFMSPIADTQLLYFDSIPSRSLIHGIMFWGFAHLWLGAFKKQTKLDEIKRKAFSIVLIAGICFSSIAEVILFFKGTPGNFLVWNGVFDILGIGMGMLTFRLLYASCY